ncbi:MAG TPA: universal stress protein [Polyangiales bacterium]
MPAIKKILCPVDFSAGSKTALTYAEGLAKRLGAELYLVHAYENPVYVLPMSGYVGPTAEILAGVRQQIDEELVRWKASVAKEGLTVRGDVFEGAPYRVVLDAADEYKPDLIVMGTHGRTGIAHVVIGSVAERVVRLAHCPVLTVRTSH